MIMIMIETMDRDKLNSGGLQRYCWCSHYSKRIGSPGVRNEFAPQE
jgi:hypothetical protein